MSSVGEAVAAELARGLGLSEQLRMSYLIGRDESSSAAAASVAAEISRSFTKCLALLAGRRGGGGATAGTKRTRPDASAPRRTITTHSPHDVDNYEWRKYGRKKIHHAEFPRSYYRCAHSAARGCPAQKQVQQLRRGPDVCYSVVYIYDHTCDLPAVATAAVGGGFEYSPAADVVNFSPSAPGFFFRSPGWGREEEDQLMVSSLTSVISGGSLACCPSPLGQSAATSATTTPPWIGCSEPTSTTTMEFDVDDVQRLDGFELMIDGVGGDDFAVYMLG